MKAYRPEWKGMIYPGSDYETTYPICVQFQQIQESEYLFCMKEVCHD